MKHKVLLGLLALGLTFTMAGCSSNSSSSGGNSISAPKKVSFVQQAKGSGTHIWLQTLSDGGGISKDNIVQTIFVMNNGKTQAYQIFDNNITLGKLSSMNDKDTINLAKEQDKKYVTTGAIQEIKNYINKKPSVGQENDFNDHMKAISNGDFYLFYTYDTNSQNKSYAKFNQHDVKNVYPSYKMAEDDTTENLVINHVSLSDLSVTTSNPDGEMNNTYGKAIINHIKKSHYKEPEAQTITSKNTTDNSGNKIINQAITYKAIDLYDRNRASKNAYDLAVKNKSDAIKLIRYTTGTYYASPAKDIDSEVVYGIDNDNDDSAFEEYKSESVAMSSEGYNIYKKIFGNKYSEITNGVYGYHKWNKTYTLGSPRSQKIFKSRYIGYSTIDNGQSYIVTKAQNSTQKAVLSK